MLVTNSIASEVVPETDFLNSYLVDSDYNSNTGLKDARLLITVIEMTKLLAQHVETSGSKVKGWKKQKMVMTF